MTRKKNHLNLKTIPEGMRRVPEILKTSFADTASWDDGKTMDPVLALHAIAWSAVAYGDEGDGGHTANLYHLWLWLDGDARREYVRTLIDAVGRIAHDQHYECERLAKDLASAKAGAK